MQRNVGRVAPTRQNDRQAKNDKSRSRKSFEESSRHMSQTITVNVPHKLGKAEATRRIREGFGAMQQSETGGLAGVLSFQRRWEGETLHFEAGGLGQQIAARLNVLDDSVQIHIDLPDLLAAIAERIKDSISKETVKALGRTK